MVPNNVEDLAVALRTLVPQITITLSELRPLLAESQNAQVAFIKPLGVNMEEGEDGEKTPVVCLTDDDYAPKPVTLEYALENIWDFTESPHRARNSLPRWVGHILVPRHHQERVAKLLVELSGLQRHFASLSGQLRDSAANEEGASSRTSMSVLMARHEIFPGNWNYELFVRELYVENRPVADIKCGWDANSMSTPKKGVLESIRPYVGDPGVLAALERYEQEYPETVFLKRFYSTPRLQTQIKYDDGEWSKKLYHSLPTIVFSLTGKGAKGVEYVHSIAPSLSVMLVDGKVRAVAKKAHASRKKQEVRQIVANAPWYAEIKLFEEIVQE